MQKDYVTLLKRLSVSELKFVSSRCKVKSQQLFKGIIAVYADLRSHRDKTQLFDNNCAVAKRLRAVGVQRNIHNIDEFIME